MASGAAKGRRKVTTRVGFGRGGLGRAAPQTRSNARHGAASGAPSGATLVPRETRKEKVSFELARAKLGRCVTCSRELRDYDGTMPY